MQGINLPLHTQKICGQLLIASEKQIALKKTKKCQKPVIN